MPNAQSSEAVKNAAQGLKNADGDSKRIVQLLRTMQAPDRLAQLKSDMIVLEVNEEDLIASVPEGAERNEVGALLKGDAAGAYAAELGNLLDARRWTCPTGTCTSQQDSRTRPGAPARQSPQRVRRQLARRAAGRRKGVEHRRRQEERPTDSFTPDVRRR